MRGGSDRKSRCPGWASEQALQEKLMQTAIDDPDGGTDSFGRPRKKWNAVAGRTFIGVSTNEQTPEYNCYPEAPVTGVADALARRAELTVEEFLVLADQPLGLAQ